jgi:aldehyde dehydrogenase (NAD+)
MVLSTDDVSADEFAANLHRVFSSGKTRSYEWRLAQLQAFKKMVVENDVAFNEALTLDLGESLYRNADETRF